jgi:hypothetical protein
VFNALGIVPRPRKSSFGPVASKNFVELFSVVSIIIKQVGAPVKFDCRFKTTSGNIAHGRVITIVIVFSDHWGRLTFELGDFSITVVVNA